MKENENQELYAKFVETYLHTFKYLGELVSAGSETYQLSFETYLLLHLISQHSGEYTMGDVARIQRTSKSAVARQITTLLKRKFVIQDVDPTDRRVRHLRITPAGREADQGITTRNSEEFTHWLTVFGREEAVIMLDYIEQFNRRLEDMGINGLEDLRHQLPPHQDD
ncbi:MarR family winged helix-turn-helix transcriptional regulator [Levilactobacillus bambusae]|uniref:MarR family winged helix-turn-helix transcriptional regulator n=1 Tax=Levilactobacillus bambusae TaxID=2024736 RepID=UPI0014038FC7|nr:MarR family transcriptional regulator [Levilactobacillus bambusae]